MAEPLRLLMVEDNEDDAELICLELERGGYAPRARRVDTRDEFMAALEEPWDLILCDFQMPSFDGIQAFTIYNEKAIDTPFIFVSGVLGEERAVEAMRLGARDYLLKGNLARLNAAVQRELAEANNHKAQRRAEAMARRHQGRLAMALEASGLGVFELAIPPGPDTYIDERCADILGYAAEELPRYDGLVEWLCSLVQPEDLPHLETACLDFVAGHDEARSVEMRVRRKDGRWIDLAVFAKALQRDPMGHANHVVGVLLDQTPHKTLEAQLRQAQKMEAIGRLASGVAHDFNNLLTVISSFGSFVLEQTNEKDAVHDDICEILKAAEQAESLTSRLLAFSRQSPMSPRLVDVDDLVERVDRWLRRVVGSDIEVSSALSSVGWKVRIDTGSLEQVIVNLAVNARDAMARGGRLALKTECTTLDAKASEAHGLQLSCGDYVVLSVADNGMGMDAATQQRIFEPFFTTKEPGKGTGLGLASCYGIVKQAGGHIGVHSQPGRGTTFRIYLPRAREDEPADPHASADEGEPIHGE